MDGATKEQYREALEVAHRHALSWLESLPDRPIRPALDDVSGYCL